MRSLLNIYLEGSPWSQDRESTWQRDVLFESCRNKPSNKRSRRSPSEHAENARRHCSGRRRTPYCPEPVVANAREGRQYKWATEPDAEAKAPLLDIRSAAKIEDLEDESEDDDSLDGNLGFDDEEEEDGDDELYKANVVPQWAFLNAGVKHFASALENSQTSEQSDGCEEDESEEYSEEETVSSVSDDYGSDVQGLMTHRERRSQHWHERFVAEAHAHIAEVQKWVTKAVAG